MKLTSPRKSRRHDPLSLYSRPATSLQLDSRPITEIWEELGVYQKAVSSTPDTAQMFMGAPTYTHIEKVFDLIKWDLSQNEPTHTSTWNIVKHWDTGPLDAEQTTEFQKTLIRIITTWRKVEENPNIAPCMGFALKSNLCPGGTGLAESIPGIVTPFYQTANEYLEGKSPTASVSPLLIDIAKALQYLHSFSPPIVQGIIRGANVLISKGPKALLTDIGLINLPLALDHEEGRWLAPELLGTLAPELFHSELVTGKRKQNAFSITPASDVFSFGLLALELITRKQPYDYIENLGINEIIGFRKCGMAQLRRPENVPAMTDELWNLLEQCVKYDPTKRPHMDSVLRFLEAIHSERGPFEELTEDTEEDIEESIFEY